MQNGKKNNYSSRRQKETVLVMLVLVILIIIIPIIVIKLLNANPNTSSNSYFIGPVVPWATEKETETETQTETESETESETQSQMAAGNNGQSENQSQGQSQDSSQSQSQANSSTQPTNQAGMMPAAPENLPEGLYYWNTHYYAFYDSATSWDEAVKFCTDKGGYLASITSEDENTVVFGFLQEKGIQNAYIGWYLDDNTKRWQWVNGEEVVYENWSPGEPNGEGGREKYGMFYYKYKTGAWNDGDFGGRTQNGGTTFVCEWNSYPANF